MRYLKLALGILLAIGGVVATIGGVGGFVFYFNTCRSAVSGSLDAMFCQENHVVAGAIMWLVAGLILDALAVVAIRLRHRSWRRSEPAALSA